MGGRGLLEGLLWLRVVTADGSEVTIENSTALEENFK